MPAIAAAITAQVVAKFVISTIISLAISFAVGALTRQKPKAPSLGGFEAQARDFRTLIRQPVTYRRVVVGESIVSGPLTFYQATSDHRYHHMVIPLAAHEVEAIKTVYFGEDPIYDEDLDGSGNVVAGKYAGKARIKKHLGASGQTADSDLVAATRVDSTFKGTGIAYIYVRTETDQDLFPSVIPGNIRAWVKGLKVYDTRTATTGWRPDPALAIRWFRTDDIHGQGVDAALVDDASVTACANVGEQFVATLEVAHDVTAVDTSTDTLDLDGDRLKFQTGDRVQVSSTGTLPTGLSAATDYYVIHLRELATDDHAVGIQLAADYDDALAETAIDLTGTGSGTITVTKNAEPRYTANGVFATDRDPWEVIDDLRTSMAGYVVPAGATLSLVPGAWAAPTITFDEDDYHGPIEVQGRHPRRERFNGVTGLYTSPLNGGIETDYPSVVSATYVAEDNDRERLAELHQPFTSRAGQCGRVAMIHLQRHRRQTTFSVPLSLAGLAVKAGDTVAFDYARRGWSGKTFDIETWELKPGKADQGDGLVWRCPITAVAVDANVYAWDETQDETVALPAGRGQGLDLFTVSAPVGLAVSSVQVLTGASDETFRAQVTWNIHVNALVTAGGRFEVQYKESADSDWQPSIFVPGELTAAPIYMLEKGVNYDVRVRAVNSAGVRSAWSSLFGFTVTSPAGATTQLDYGEVSDSVTATLDYGQVSDAVTAELDYGEVA